MHKLKDVEISFFIRHGVLKSRPMKIMAKSPNLVDSAYHGVYHRFWGVYTIMIV